MSKNLIVFANSNLIKYMKGGGALWCFYLQFLLGLKNIQQDVLLLELMWSSNNKDQDEEQIKSFFKQLKNFDLESQCVVLLFPNSENWEEQNIDSATSYGKDIDTVKRIISSADILWNDSCCVRQPLLSMFKHRVLLDLDPGLLQISSLTVDIGIEDHHRLLTIGSKILDSDCEVPTLGMKWKPFTPFVYPPMWDLSSDPGYNRPFSAITHWGWKELYWNNRVLSISKRDAYLKYINLPNLTKRSFELAILLHPDHDKFGDRKLLKSHNWNLVDPWEVAESISDYQHYIKQSRAEIMCPKPIHNSLKTGYISDRCVSYLASGRPVLIEETGISDQIKTDKGLLTFSDEQDAAEQVAEIDKNYAQHSKAARELVEEHFRSDKCLAKMLDDCR